MSEEQIELDCGEVSVADMLAHADEAPPRAKWAGRVAEMVDVLHDDNVRHHRMAPDEALEHAQRTVLVLAGYFGGRPIYMPRGDALATALRDRAIYIEYHGSNKEQLAARYGLTVRTIERIYVEQRALAVSKRQARLFESE